MKFILFLALLILSTALFATTSGTTLTIIDCVPNTSYKVSIGSYSEVLAANITTSSTLSYGGLVQLAYQGSCFSNYFANSHFVIQLQLTPSGSSTDYYITMGFNWDDLTGYGNSTTIIPSSDLLYEDITSLFESSSDYHYIPSNSLLQFSSSLPNTTYQVQYEDGAMNNDFYMVLLPAPSGSTVSHVANKLTSNKANG